jgi:hypothetical protein
MHDWNKLPSNVTPANGVKVDAYYVMPYDAIVNQCWDLHRIHTLSQTNVAGSSVSYLKAKDFLHVIAAPLSTATLSLLVRALEEFMTLFPCFLVPRQPHG